jgi:RNA polymerase sigma factor (sigma-70 family)
MTHTFLDCVLRGAEALAGRDGVGALADPDLLRRFAADRDQAAFAVLVRRHGSLVWGVCRNLLPADADAEDAFQATFLALVRSAGTIRQTEALGGWLHGVAYRVAMKARRTAARRKRRESIAAVPEPGTPIPDAAWDDLQAAVHEEVCRLPEKLRLPFVLCGLQGRQQKDVAKQLGWKVGTLSGRLSQARQRLLDRLARRGVPVGMAAGAAVLGMASGNAAVPFAISSKAIAAAANPVAVSPIVTSLARGVTTMYLTRTKMLIAGVLLAGALSTGIGSRLISTAEAQPPASDPSPEAIKKALDYLRSHQTQERWEYKFVAVEKPLVAADLQKLLSASDHEGWEYCGTQELVTRTKDGKVGGSAIPHMVFKRPRALASADADARTAAGLAALALQQAEAAEREAKAKALAEEKLYFRAIQDAHRQSALEAEQAKSAAEHRARAADMLKKQADQSASDLARERDRIKQLEEMILISQSEQAALRKRLEDLEAQRSRPGTSRPSNPDPITASDSLIIQLKGDKADDVAKVLEKVFPTGGYKASIDTRTNTLTVHGPRELLTKVKELVEKSMDGKASFATADSAVVTPNVPVTALVEIGKTDAKVAIQVIEKAVGDVKIVDVRPDGIVLTGPSKSINEVRDLLKKISAEALTRTDEKVEIATIRLKHANASGVQSAINKLYDKSDKKVVMVSDASTNTLIVTGPPSVVADIKKLADALDVSSGPAK